MWTFIAGFVAGFGVCFAMAIYIDHVSKHGGDYGF